MTCDKNYTRASVYYHKNEQYVQFPDIYNIEYGYLLSQRMMYCQTHEKIYHAQLS